MSPLGCLTLAASVVTLLLSVSAAASAQDGSHVLVVVNTASPLSASIAARYMRARAVPPENLVSLKTGTGDEIDRPSTSATSNAPSATG